MSAELTPKEEEIMKVAWRCLKSGPPEIDIEKLKVLGGFNTTKTASNTWGAIKKKLMAEISDTGDAVPAAPKKAAKEPATPRAKKGTAAPASGRKRSKKAAAADDSDDSDYAIGINRNKKAKTPVKKDESSFNFEGEEA